MTCFWDGNMKALGNDLLKNVLGCNNRPSPREFVKLLKQRSVKTYDVLCNNEQLKEQTLTENLISIKELKIESINNGYYCSACDPYLLLISQLFVINIHHNFNGTIINYINKHATKTVNVRSSSGHFYHVNK